MMGQQIILQGDSGSGGHEYSFFRRYRRRRCHFMCFYSMLIHLAAVLCGVEFLFLGEKQQQFLVIVEGFMPRHRRRLKKINSNVFVVASSSSSSPALVASSLFSSSTDTTTLNDNNNNITITPSTQQQQQQQKVCHNRRRKKWTVNTHVRSIMNLLESRYGGNDEDDDKDDGGGGGDWRRIRAYLYRSGGEDKLPLEQVRDVIDFLDIYVTKSPQITKHIIQTIPRILRKPVSSFLKPTVQFLEDLWGPDLFQQAIQRNPQLLLSSGVGYVENNNNKKYKEKYSTNTSSASTTSVPASAETINEKENYDNDGSSSVEQILIEITNLSSKSIKKLKRSSPFVFGLSPMKVKSVLGFLFNLLQHHKKKIDVPASVRKIIVSHPNLLNLNIETNLQPSIDFFQSSICGFDDVDIAKLIHTSSGSVLGLSLEKNLKPTIDFLLQQHLLDNSQPALQKCIVSHPQILGLSLKNLQSKVSYFESIKGGDDDDDDDDGRSTQSLSSKIAVRCPSVFSLSLQGNLIPTIRFLSKVWGVPISNDDEEEEEENDENINENGRQLSKYLKEYPNILTLSLEGNIQPTIDFFNKTGYTELNDDWELISKNRIRGRYLASSLFNRLLPRWHYSINMGKTDELPLHVLVSSDDVAFCDHLESNVDDFRYFKKETIPSLKFSSQFDTWLKTGRRIEI